MVNNILDEGQLGAAEGVLAKWFAKWLSVVVGLNLVSVMKKIIHSRALSYGL